jgi:ribonuclease HI
VGNTTFLPQALDTSTLVIATDGSYRAPYGAGAWIITTQKMYPSNFVTGTAQSPGNASVQDSHRAELTAILGAIIHLHQLCTSYNKNTGSVTICCDNSSAINYALDVTKYPNVNSKMPDFDIISAIRHSLLSGFTYSCKHVKGHQDRFYGPLDFWATLNTVADTHAGIRCQSISSSLPDLWLPHETVALYAGPNKLCKHIDSALYDFYSQPTMLRYWTKQRGYSNQTTFSDVAWPAIHAAGTEIPLQKRRWITKHATGLCGVNACLFKWKQRDDDKCPRCGLTETSTHVWKCNGMESLTIWTTALANLSDWMLSVHTSPEIITSINTNLLAWVTGSTFPSPRSTYEDAQDRIGWDHFLEGSLSNNWASTQQHHYISINKLNSGQRWLTELIKKLWKIAWDIWTYRNGIAAEANNRQLTTSLNLQINTALQTISASQTQLQPHIYSEQTISALQSANLGTKRSWLSAFTAHQNFLHKNKRRRTELKGMQDNLQRFLKK